MTTADGRTAEGSTAEGSAAEWELAARVIDTLLREDYGGLSSRMRLDVGGPVLELPTDGGGTGRLLPLEPDGFLADFRVRRSAAGQSRPPLTLDDVDAVLAAISDPLDAAGVTAFAAECREALATQRQRERHLPGDHARLARLWQAAPDALSGPRGLLAYEALAATVPHPVYPTSQARRGFTEDDALRYAPEYAPEFQLHWIAVPRSLLVVAGRDDRPPGWPTPSDVGLPSWVAATHDLIPVHPLTARRELVSALTEIGAPADISATADSGFRTETGAGAAAGGGAGAGVRAMVAPDTSLRVTPTLSMRTVAVSGQPDQHIKLPLPTSTLGLLNRRFIPPGTLADGALVRRILAAITAAEGAATEEAAGAGDDRAQLGAALLLADESSYAHAGHPYLGYLLRRLPPGLDRCRIVSVAALPAPSPAAVMLDRSGTGQPTVIEELAGWGWDGDLLGLFGDYLDVLFNVHVRLFARYGIALESHQQNIALVLGPPGDPVRLRLLVKDFDSTLIHLPRLAGALGPAAPVESAFADPRLVTRSDDALADVFITITVHLCAGALAFDLARRGAAPLPDLLALIRRKLTAALDRQAGWPATSVLRSRVLDAARLPGKSMVTAGTLVAKARTGASDINKFYGTDGPNYLMYPKPDDNDRSCQ